MFACRRSAPMSSAHADTDELLIVRTPDIASPARPVSMQVRVDLGAASHTGLVRPNNEDSYLVARADRSLETLLTNLPPGEIPAWAAERSFGLVVADGMGGEAAGEVASRLALRAVVEHVLATADWIMSHVAARSVEIEERIVQRFAAADEAVQDEARGNPRWTGMGTTMTLAISSGDDLFLGHIGDSRAYLLRGAAASADPRPHVRPDAGRHRRHCEREVAVHRMRNVLLRSLGRQNARADVRHLQLESGDQLLLCTDGLTDMVAEPAIREILQTEPTAQAACDQLVARPSPPAGKTTSPSCWPGTRGKGDWPAPAISIAAKFPPCDSRSAMFCG